MIRLALMDMDGTLFHSYLDWQEIRRELSIGEGSILQSIYQKKDPESRSKMILLEKWERENTLKTKPRRGVRHFLSFLKHKSIITALVTNNNRENTDYLLDKFSIQFDLVITREIGLWKPDPAPFFHVLNFFQISPEQTVSIGDSKYDILASQAAGISKIYIVQKRKIAKSNGITSVSGFYQLNQRINDLFMSTCRHK